jgi:hypothetical protein
MSGSLRLHLRNNLVGYMALFVALGGTSYAVGTGSIDSREIKNNTVRGRDLRNNDVRSADVRDGSLLRKDFRPGQLLAGPRGPQGPAGGLTGQEIISRGFTSNPHSDDVGFAPCPQGKVVLGGGVFSFQKKPIYASVPVLTGWEAFVTNPDDDAGDFEVYVVCANGG